MNTSSHISATAGRELPRVHVKQAMSAALAIALIAATFTAWYVILDTALSSIR
jgi:hypothetical protein